MKRLFGTLTSLVVSGIVLTSTATAAPIQWTVGVGGNDHWYEFINTNVTAENAFLAAAAATHLGENGYLATVTSAAENSFVAATVAGGSLAWLGGSDGGAPINQWSWRNGPEFGQAFTYTNWGGGEPNNCCGGENFLHVNFGGPGLWNDHGGPGNPTQVNGYVIEFGGTAVPEPATLAMLGAGLTLLRLRRKNRRS